jgi:putative redox protein
MSRDVAVMSRSAGYLQNISIGQHQIQADEPVEAGGCDAGPNPYELLLAALEV